MTLKIAVVELSVQCYRLNMWAESYAAAKSALQISDKALVYTMDPEVWGEKPWDYASIAAWNLGLKDEAINLCQKALELAPNDERIGRNLHYMTTGEFPKTFDHVVNHDS